MTRRVNEDGLKLIRQWEGLRTTAYKCPAGVWTIGYGHTSAAGAPTVSAGMKITTAAAEDILKADLRKYEQAVDKAVKVGLSDNQFSALVSFCYNVGPGAFAGSTLVRKLNAGRYDAVPSELAKWTKAGGKNLPGLVNRRAAEAGLWARGSFVSSSTEEVAPPVKQNPALTPEAIGGYVATGATIVTAMGGLSGPIAWAFAALIFVGAGYTAWMFVKRLRED
jgi:lysozyme